jgi:hypothetical protein
MTASLAVNVVFALIILSIPAVYFTVRTVLQKKWGEMRYLLETEGREEFFQGVREYLLKPYSSPLTSAMRPEIPQDEQGIYDFYRYNYMENYRQRKGQSKLVLPILVAGVIVGIIPLLLIGDLSWYMLLLFVVILGTGIAFAVMMYKWAKAEGELVDWLEERMSSYLEETEQE